MAYSLKVSSSYISAIELGKRNVPFSLIEKLSTIYQLDKLRVNDLRQAAAESETTLKIDLKQNSDTERDLAYAFARSYRNLDPEKQQQLKEFLGVNE